DYAIFAVIEYDLHKIENHYLTLLQRLTLPGDEPPPIISLNYDIIVDNTLLLLAERQNRFGFPDYGCDIATESYRQPPKFGKIYKLHGSMNWLYCPACQRLDIGTSRSGRGTVKVLDMIYAEEQHAGGDLQERYGCHGSPCRDCRAYVSAVMISPTHLKDYRNPHISQVWYLAERALRQAERAIIAGYSMPWDDVDVIYLLKRGLGELPAGAITVVEYDPQNRPARQHPVGNNYCKVFGEAIDWHTEGFESFVKSYQPGRL
ncbi:MAG TPA: hypothetical protein VMS71_06985, partial [Candidatus Acidoferrum sp.]|nr:hypothetical protein [Candidatus Acidoferrum sp.]